MGRVDWDKVQEIYHRARRLRDTDQHAFVREACNGDRDLQREVASLLDASAQATDFLATPFWEDTNWIDASGVTPARLMQASELADPVSPVPDRVGEYEIVREIGRGGMGIVYLARDPALGRRVALKVLPAHLSSDPARFQHLKNEAHTLSQLEHPNIAAFYSLEQAGSTYFFTMEWVPGESLSETLLSGPLPLQTAISLTHQVAAALEESHAQGVIHCDLKPSNVRVTGDGHAKVVDFGGARGVATQQRRTDASGKGIVGTPGYMSPEQLRGQTLDHRSDVWALGCVLFEMVTGSKVFTGTTRQEQVSRTLTTRPEITRPLKRFSPELRQLIHHCLQPDPARRVSSMTSIRQALEALPTGESLPGRSSATQAAVATHSGEFVGRESEIAEITDKLDAATNVILTGPAGCGKSRLCVEVASRSLEHFDRVVQLEMTRWRDPESMLRGVASTLALPSDARSSFDTIASGLRGQSLLLILDNCDHVLRECTQLVDALERKADGVRVIVSCRRLGPGRSGAHSAVQLGGLQLPEPTHTSLRELAQNESVRFFTARAREAAPDFTLTEENSVAVVEICRRLEGNPWTLELAAVRVSSIPLHELALRIDDRLRQPGGKSGGNALLEWSFSQLGSSQRTLLARASVFRGGWTLDAAKRVCSGGAIEEDEVAALLNSLVQLSLVEVQPDESRDPSQGALRYWLLESIATHARSLLTAEEELRAQGQHLEFFERMARCLDSLSEPSPQRWYPMIDDEFDNLLVALQHESDPLTERQLQLASWLGRYWLDRGRPAEGNAIFDRLLDTPFGKRRTALRARALRSASAVAARAGQPDRAIAHAEECLALSTEFHETSTRVGALVNLGLMVRLRREPDLARRYLEQGLTLAREYELNIMIPHLLNNLADLAGEQGDYDTSRKLYEEQLSHLGDAGDAAMRLKAYQGLALTGWRQGKTPEARACYERALGIARALGDRFGMAAAFGGLGILFMEEGQTDSARIIHHQSLALRREIGYAVGVASSLTNLGIIAQLQGDLDEAEELHEEALSIRREQKEPRGTSTSLAELAIVYRDREEWERARKALVECLELRVEIGSRNGICDSLFLFATLAARQGASRRCLRLFAASESIRSEIRGGLADEELEELNRCREQAEQQLRAEGLDENSVASVWTAGAALPVDEAVAEALAK